MSEYIEREALLYEIAYGAEKPEIYDGAQLCWWTRKCLKAAPVADVAPVVHARWVKEWSDAAGVEFCCSQCASANKNMDSYYCPNCGAKMDLKEDDDG